MRLSKNEKKILSAVELKANITIEQIARKSGMQIHTARYSLNKLIERSIISLHPLINYRVVGYNAFNIFFTLGYESRTLRASFIKELIATKEIIWLGEMGADFQFGIGVAAKSIYHLKILLYSLTEKFGNVFNHKVVSTQFSTTLFSRGYLGYNKALHTLKISVDSEAIEIDSLDRKILGAIDRHSNQSHRKVAALLEVPLSTFELRLAKLEQKKIIVGHFYSVDVLQLGISYFKILIFSKGFHPSLTESLEDFGKKHPNIISFIQCFGSWDFEFGAEVEHPQDIVAITQEIYEQFGSQITQVKTLSQFKDIIVRSSPF